MFIYINISFSSTGSSGAVGKKLASDAGIQG